MSKQTRKRRLASREVGRGRPNDRCQDVDKWSHDHCGIRGSRWIWACCKMGTRQDAGERLRWSPFMEGLHGCMSAGLGGERWVGWFTAVLGGHTGVCWGEMQCSCGCCFQVGVYQEGEFSRRCDGRILQSVQVLSTHVPDANQLFTAQQWYERITRVGSRDLFPDLPFSILSLFSQIPKVYRYLCLTSGAFPRVYSTDLSSS